MGTQTATAGVQQTHRWHVVTRTTLRFCFAYIGLYFLATQFSGGLFPLPNTTPPGLGTMWPMREITFWWAGQFHVVSPLAYTGNSLDTAFYWVQTCWILIVALVGTWLWSVLDARRDNYVTLHQWFRLVLRFGLAAQMFYCGTAAIRRPPSRG